MEVLDNLIVRIRLPLLAHCLHRTQCTPMSAQADERVFVLYDGMAGYGAESTLERPTDDACERRFVAEGVSKLKITRFFGGRGATPPEVPRGLYSAF